MLTTDFTGTYDYEKEEAEYAARYILDDFLDGTISFEEMGERIMKERVHWKKCIPETFDEFDKYFLAFIATELNK